MGSSQEVLGPQKYALQQSLWVLTSRARGFWIVIIDKIKWSSSVELEKGVHRGQMASKHRLQAPKHTGHGRYSGQNSVPCSFNLGTPLNSFFAQDMDFKKSSLTIRGWDWSMRQTSLGETPTLPAGARKLCAVHSGLLPEMCQLASLNHFWKLGLWTKSATKKTQRPTRSVLSSKLGLCSWAHKETQQICKNKNACTSICVHRDADI